MKVDWCWICRRQHPMLDDATFDAVWRAYRAAEDALIAASRQPAPDGESPRERLLRIQGQRPPELPPGTTSRQLRFRPLQEAYERVTGLTFDGDDPLMIQHYRASYYGPPCPYCGRLLRNARAKQCLECSMDWHDPRNVVCHRPEKQTDS